MHRKSQVLVNAALLPEDSLRIRVVTLKRFYALKMAQPPPPFAKLFHIHKGRRPAVCPLLFPEPPAAQVMRAGHDARSYSFRQPHANYEMAYVRYHPGERPIFKTLSLTISRVHP
jgi:hypothetical protein